MHILVTGSSGTIGTRLMETLALRGIQATGVDWLPNKWKPDIQARTTIADLRHAETLDSLPADIDTIVHLAANARVYDLVEDPSKAHDNVTTTFNMLEFARARGIKKFLFASSREVYGNEQKVDVYTEDMVHVEHTESPYSASKLADEAFVQSYTRCYGVDHVIFRFSNVYGMYDDSNRVVPLFIRLAKANETLKVFGKDKCLDFTYIDDCVDGIIKAIEKFDTAKNDTYNLAFNQGTTILQVAEDVKRMLGSSSAIEIGNPRTGEVVRYTADITKARRKLGYDPKTSYGEGIAKSVEWYAANV
ncbi:MAG: dependent epimerase/dehydratase family [Candidatus Peribacteria bacterium]|nr:dependent epimerase/dehydratase family [Candidatus Peribacteria bacterium]